MDSVLMDGWFSLTLVQQMINIGNEVKRAVRFDENAEKKHAFLVKAIQQSNIRILQCRIQKTKESFQSWISPGKYYWIMTGKSISLTTPRNS